MIKPNEFFEIPFKIGRGNSIKLALQMLHLQRIKNGLFSTQCEIVETGTSRGIYGGGPDGDGWATLAFAWYAKKFNARVTTIDIERKHLDECRRLINGVIGNDFNCIEYECNDSVEYFASFPHFHEGTLLLYLDSMDVDESLWDHPLGKIVNEYSQQHMKNEFILMEHNLLDYSIILLDDVPIDYLNRGKAAKLIKYMLKRDYMIVNHDCTPGVCQMLLCKASSVPEECLK